MDKVQGFSIELKNIRLATGSLEPFSFDLAPGEVCEIQSDSSDHARSILKLLATLERPAEGIFMLDGNELDFSHYQSLLPVKRRIASITTDAALITNRSLQENILIGEAWYKNTMQPDMPPLCRDLCQKFRIEERLHLRPAATSPMEQRAAIAVRGLAKSPGLILVERPEDFVGRQRKALFLDALKSFSRRGATLVFWSDDTETGRNWATRKWMLEGRNFREITP
ncbi:hypothetical protein LZ24_01040 [Desulfobotulus alkaliphilus]|uniref:ABC transporter domain-containing protein n=1 Tax=Desulfobotulus alkaliphilus TaxID=622671 RepID=A0A562S0N0_9BACT|nr:hypothetical protein [Desulfobotulus alkaliphilus]TWI74100.1 hypothetical protein LZ24_01040 [Desulfobotulus alkaliphilus]